MNNIKAENKTDKSNVGILSHRKKVYMKAGPIKIQSKEAEFSTNFEDDKTIIFLLNSKILSTLDEPQPERYFDENETLEMKQGESGFETIDFSQEFEEVHNCNILSEIEVEDKQKNRGNFFFYSSTILLLILLGMFTFLV